MCIPVRSLSADHLLTCPCYALFSALPLIYPFVLLHAVRHESYPPFSCLHQYGHKSLECIAAPWSHPALARDSPADIQLELLLRFLCFANDSECGRLEVPLVGIDVVTSMSRTVAPACWEHRVFCVSTTMHSALISIPDGLLLPLVLKRPKYGAFTRGCCISRFDSHRSDNTSQEILDGAHILHVTEERQRKRRLRDEASLSLAGWMQQRVLSDGESGKVPRPWSAKEGAEAEQENTRIIAAKRESPLPSSKRSCWVR